MTDEEWLKIPYERRLEIAEYIFNKITDGPCSFRKLIYDRLGFNGDAYAPLLYAGGMRITNSIRFDEIACQEDADEDNSNQ